MFAFTSYVLIGAAAFMNIADAESSRKSYSDCLTDYMISALDQKSTVSAFKKSAPDACPAERKAMIDAIKKDEMGFGSSAVEASEYATEEADGVLFSFTDGYSGYESSGTRPVK